jgi:dTDP-4-amino-4,6-dideoxygalactose transaminase
MLAQHPTLRFTDLVTSPRTGLPLLTSHRKRLYDTYDARVAIFQVCQSLTDRLKKPVLIPGFHCPSVIDPVLAAGCHVKLYRVNTDLEIDLDHLESLMKKGVSAIIVIHFFGIQSDLRTIVALTERYGGVLIEDWAHAFMNAATKSLPGDRGDIAIYSFYKHVPTCAGGAIRIINPEIIFSPSMGGIGVLRTLRIIKTLADQIALNAPDGLVRSAYFGLDKARRALRAYRRKHSFDANSTSLYDFDPALAKARMPWISRWIYGHIERDTMIDRRRRAFEVWNSALRENESLKKVIRRLPQDACPWAYPVLVANRSRYDVQLRSLGVPLFTFGETLHSCIAQSDPLTRSQAEFLANNLLLFSTHQCLTVDQVEAAAISVNKFFERTGQPSTITATARSRRSPASNAVR